MNTAANIDPVVGLVVTAVAAGAGADGSIVWISHEIAGLEVEDNSRSTE